MGSSLSLSVHKVKIWYQTKFRSKTKNKAQGIIWCSSCFNANFQSYASLRYATISFFFDKVSLLFCPSCWSLHFSSRFHILFFFDNLAAHSILRKTIRTESTKKKTGKKKELKEKSTHKIAAYTISSAPNRRQTEVKSNGSNIIFIRNRTLLQHPMTITSSKKKDKKTIEGSIFFDCYDCCHFSLFSLLCKIYKYAHLLVHL